MPLPSRGKRKSGALEPSFKADAADALVVPLGGFLAGEFPAAGFATVVVGFCRLTRGFEGVLGDAAGAAPPVSRRALFELAERAFGAGVVFSDFGDRTRTASPERVLGDFLRGLLAIRLPFVAFGRSIMMTGRSRPAGFDRVACWASLTASEYGDKEFEASPVDSPNDE